MIYCLIRGNGKSWTRCFGDDAFHRRCRDISLRMIFVLKDSTVR